VTVPGARYAFQVVHPGSPMLRIRYRDGVAIDPYGFPDWIPYARILVELPAHRDGTGIDEARVLDVLTANASASRANHPLWTNSPAGSGTPAGWTWAHVARSRQLALVPAELHAAFRHLGGVSTGDTDRHRRGLPAEPGPPPPIRFSERLDAAALDKVEERLGYRLPAAYRSFLARTNGGRPAWPAVHPGFGFVVDQPLFGLAQRDWLQDLLYANAWLGDRMAPHWLAIGHVQGGLLAVRVHGGDEGSVWYRDDDDPRDLDDPVPARPERLLHRCAETFAAFWRALRPVPQALQAAARTRASRAALLAPAELGASLPATRRGP
jgi:hypothetical protein